MARQPAARVYAVVVWVALCLLLAKPAQAQFQPRPLNDPATGERYHIEVAAGFWFPTAEMSISSQSLGIPGSVIDFKKDLGLTDQRFPELHLELRGGRNKLRLQYIPIKYTQSGILSREIVFNAQKYTVGLPVNSELDWKAYRIGYEIDFVSKDRGFAGLIFDLKYTDVKAQLASPVATEFAQAKAPIPAIGGIFRVYPASNVSITGEITGFRLPEKLIKDTTGHYLDMVFYGTLNFTNNVGVQVGYRSIDVGYVVNAADTGAFKLKGLFFGLVGRY